MHHIANTDKLYQQCTRTNKLYFQNYKLIAKYNSQRSYALKKKTSAARIRINYCFNQYIGNYDKLLFSQQTHNNNLSFGKNGDWIYI